MNRMHSFVFRAIGILARNPGVAGVEPDKFSTRFCLVTDNFVVEDPVCRSRVRSVRFIAVDSLGDELSIEARKDDQLVVEGVFREHWNNQNKRTEANRQVSREFIFLVTGYRIDARRQPPGTARDRVTDQPAQPRDGAAADVATVAA